MISRLLSRVGRLMGGPRFGELSLDEAAAKVGKPNVHFFDVNPPDVFAKGHVPGARNLPAHDVTEKDLPADKAATLVFYCGSAL